MASVHLERVRKNFGKLPVIHGVDLSIDDGEFVVLVGPSGCGKSTLLRMIAGLEETTSGDIHIGRRVVNALSPKERNIAMVFQSYALYPHMTVFDNISLSLRLSRIGKDAVRQKVDWAAGILNLDSLLDRLPSQLSGGQRQRVAMGRAIVRNPDLFLFDEPLSNLDAKLRVQMRTEIRELHQDLRATTIYVTHDQIEAMTMADRIVVMDQGHVLQVGTPFEVYDQPANLTVAGFIGSPSMNLLTCATPNDGGGLVIDGASVIPGDRLDTTLSDRPAEAAFVLGVRPEDLDVVDAASGFPASVKVVEPTGPDTIVMVETGKLELNLLVRERTTLTIGDTIGLTVRPGKAHIFDAETQNRLGTV